MRVVRDMTPGKHRRGAKKIFLEVSRGVRGGGRATPTHPLIEGADIDITQDIYTVSFHSNAWEESKPGILTFLLGASRGGGP